MSRSYKIVNTLSTVAIFICTILLNIVFFINLNMIALVLFPIALILSIIALVLHMAKKENRTTLKATVLVMIVGMLLIGGGEIKATMDNMREDFILTFGEHKMSEGDFFIDNPTVAYASDTGKPLLKAEVAGQDYTIWLLDDYKPKYGDYIVIAVEYRSIGNNVVIKDAIMLRQVPVEEVQDEISSVIQSLIQSAISLKEGK